MAICMPVLCVGLWTYLQFGEGESTASTYAAVVFERRAADDGSEFVDGTRGYGSSFLHASIAAAGFSTGLARSIRTM